VQLVLEAHAETVRRLFAEFDAFRASLSRRREPVDQIRQRFDIWLNQLRDRAYDYNGPIFSASSTHPPPATSPESDADRTAWTSFND
jgi:hypothetical protein